MAGPELHADVGWAKDGSHRRRLLPDRNARGRIQPKPSETLQGTANQGCPAPHRHGRQLAGRVEGLSFCVAHFHRRHRFLFSPGLLGLSPAPKVPDPKIKRKSPKPLMICVPSYHRLRWCRQNRSRHPRPCTLDGVSGRENVLLAICVLLITRG